MATVLVAGDIAGVQAPPLRVLAFMKYGPAAAATRHRLKQYEPFLAAHGVTVEHDYLLDDSYVAALAAGKRKPWATVAASYVRRLAVLARRRDFDVAFVHAELFPGLPLDHLAAVIGKPVVYDLDDALYLQHAQGRFPGKLRRLWRQAHCIAGNEFLAAEMGKHARSCAVIPTTVDTDIWKPAARCNVKPVIGWIGSPSTWEYVEPLLPAIWKAMAKHDAVFRVFGAGERARRHGWIEVRDWSADTEVAAVQGMDIGIMPLPNSDWARGKCGFKLIQYMACGLPTIASSVGMNREIVVDGETGFLASREDEWAAALDALLTNAALRQRMGWAGREVAVDRYSLQSQAPRVIEVFRRAGGTNLHAPTVTGFGEEWSRYDQSRLSPSERNSMCAAYFHDFPVHELANGEGFDLGCGSGRWAACLAPHVRRLHCIDPAEPALLVARRNLRGRRNVSYHHACASTIPLADGSQDFGYSLGVLHHVPDTEAALRSAVAKLKPGAPFLLYLYYALENRPTWYRALWHVTRLPQFLISRMPHRAKVPVTTAIAALIYWPLARLARLTRAPNAPLATYADRSFYTMRTDALDRFGTQLEKRFTCGQIADLMAGAGLVDVRFNHGAPYWVAWGRKGWGRKG